MRRTIAIVETQRKEGGGIKRRMRRRRRLRIGLYRLLHLSSTYAHSQRTSIGSLVNPSLLLQVAGKKSSVNETRFSSAFLTFVEWIVGVGLQEQVLESDHDGVQVEDWFPIFSENIEADVSFQIEIRVVDLRHTIVSFDWPVMGGERGGDVLWEYI